MVLAGTSSRFDLNTYIHARYNDTRQFNNPNKHDISYLEFIKIIFLFNSQTELLLVLHNVKSDETMITAVTGNR